jgi:hypothetical protein
VNAISHRQRSVATLAVLIVAAATLVRGQGPGDGWMLAPTPERSIKLLYWDLANVTEVWTRIVPRVADGSARIPASLVVSARFKGKVGRLEDLSAPPDEMSLLAQPDPHAVVVTPSLLLRTIDAAIVDTNVNEPPGVVRLIAPCSDCGATAVLTSLKPATLRSLASAKTIACEVLGFKCVLDRLDLEALRRFARCTKVEAGRCDVVK